MKCNLHTHTSVEWGISVDLAILFVVRNCLFTNNWTIVVADDSSTKSTLNRIETIDAHSFGTTPTNSRCRSSWTTKWNGKQLKSICFVLNAVWCIWKRATFHRWSFGKKNFHRTRHKSTDVSTNVYAYSGRYARHERTNEGTTERMNKKKKKKFNENKTTVLQLLTCARLMINTR